MSFNIHTSMTSLHLRNLSIEFINVQIALLVIFIQNPSLGTWTYFVTVGHVDDGSCECRLKKPTTGLQRTQDHTRDPVAIAPYQQCKINAKMIKLITITFKNSGTYFWFHFISISIFFGSVKKHIGVSGRELAQGLLIIHRQVNCICWPDGHLRVASVTRFDAWSNDFKTHSYQSVRHCNRLIYPLNTNCHQEMTERIASQKDWSFKKGQWHCNIFITITLSSCDF